ncbi:MAG TPA: hypothetical protein VFI52_03060 [Gemmatimonadaceae bacterium]|nr:hypothetical protein [Gemmatimonadaceae bacterium]
MNRWPALLLLIIAMSATANAQTAAASPDSACTYRTCALAIVPSWDGLAVVRGQAGPRVANLHFFLPRDITPALRGDDVTRPGADSAAAEAGRALSLRRVGAAFTDLGLLAMGAAVASALHARHVDRSAQTLGAAGMGALLVSVPFQFAADGALSRAVWWHNQRFAR